MRQNKQSQNGRHWYFIIERFTMQLKKRLKDFDVISTTKKKQTNKN